MIHDTASTEALSASVSRFSLSLARSLPAAEDLAQESWTRALPALRDGRHPNPEALLLRIARNVWIDGLRRETRLARLTQVVQAAGRELGEASQSQSDRPLRALELAPVFASLNRHLPSLQRAVFLMRDVLGYSIRETAQRLGRSPGAVKAAHHRSRQALAAVRREWEAEDGPPLPADEGAAIEAHLMADAYARGDVAALIALANGEADMRARQAPLRASSSRRTTGAATEGPTALAYGSAAA